MAKFRVPFSREEFGYIYFDAKDEAMADELVAQMEQGILNFEDLPSVVVKVKGGEESVQAMADELVAQMEQGILNFEDLPSVVVKVKGGEESVQGWNVEEVS